MRSNIALSYIVMLTIVGFLLWIIRNFVRALRQKNQLAPLLSIPEQQEGTDKKAVDWPVHIFLCKDDDIPIPGRLLSISPASAFMQSSAGLKTGQEISLYVDLPGRDQVRLTAKVIWARDGRDGKNAAQLSFFGLSADKKKELFFAAKESM